MIPTPPVLFDYDLDGRVDTIRTNYFSDGFGGTWNTADYFGFGTAHSVYTSVGIGGATGGSYGYYYDADDRRVEKQYPVAGVEDDYYYDGSHLIEDVRAATPTSRFPVSDDAYIWLGGVPVAFVRGSLDSNWARMADFGSSCEQDGQSSPCGVFFVVNDASGRPALILDSNGKVAEYYDYDPFGHANRVSMLDSGEHPYNNNDNEEIAQFTEPFTSQTEVKARARFYTVDTEGTSWDYAHFEASDGSSIAGSPIVGNQRQGATVTAWFMPPSNGVIDTWFHSDGSNYCPNGSGGIYCTNCSLCPNYPYMGTMLSSFDYERFQINASPVTIPLRYPGQYHDEETDLFENWHRYYDADVGRYLETDPARLVPRSAPMQAAKGLASAAYAYAANDPLRLTDSDGNIVTTDKSCDQKFSSLINKLTNSVATSKNCRCKQLFRKDHILEKLLSREHVYVVHCERGKVMGHSDWCGYGSGNSIYLNTDPGCLGNNCGPGGDICMGPPACFAKNLIHELLHTDPDAMTHAPTANTSDPSYEPFNQAEACIKCDGTLIQN